MKKLKRVLVAVLCAITATSTAFAFGGCGTKAPENQKPGPGTEITNPDTPVKPDPENPPVVTPDPEKPDPEKPDTPVVDDSKEKFEKAVAEANGFIDSLSDRDFTYQLSAGTVLVNETKMKVNDSFYELGEDGVQYEYALSKSDNKYHKTIYDAEMNMDYFGEIDDMLTQLGMVAWKSEKDGILLGDMSGRPIEYKVSGDKCVLTLDGEDASFYNINATNVSTPAEYVDETAPVVDTENIFDEQGNMRC